MFGDDAGMSNAAVLLAERLTPDEQERFLAEVAPFVNDEFFDGAPTVVEVLYELMNHDAYLGLVERLYEDHEAEVRGNALFCPAVYAALFLRGYLVSEPCRACRGSGVFPLSREEVPCPSCHGDKELMLRSVYRECRFEDAWEFASRPLVQP